MTLPLSNLPIPPPGADDSVPRALEELPRNLMRASMAWKSCLGANYAAEGLDGTVPVGAGLILFALYGRNGWKIGELARRARVTHVAVLHLLEKLEAAGLVARKACPKDNRSTRVWLTRRGGALRGRMMSLHRRNLSTLAGVLGREDAIRLGELLERLVDGLAPADRASLPPASRKTKTGIRRRKTGSPTA
jgi:DNA-binding MarR family transcriptional regulator